MKGNLTVWMLLLCMMIGLILLMFNIISWTSYFIVVLIVGVLTYMEKRKRMNRSE
ncbi:hypothetical protein A5844_000007 [Enterococcus sp. 10A9_DIV0425]|uniref:Uncharacterized protein n=1 Tax=Candidatus Enterococcus wittei TaxID=1987383 RepID=A0A2C9XNM1_9ENTE|nr:hypothetical protein [Enterococcus sp. 10A9_DIV0425]OTP11793.1 hypothetical protein A5844_000007 [Enterococcus sp. 10A9_DIV0425]